MLLGERLGDGRFSVLRYALKSKEPVYGLFAVDPFLIMGSYDFCEKSLNQKFHIRQPTTAAVLRNRTVQPWRW